MRLEVTERYLFFPVLTLLLKLRIDFAIQTVSVSQVIEGLLLAGAISKNWCSYE